MKIGLFGGTFDPIHMGHVDMIRQVCEHIPLDKVIFIPAYIPPHKNKTITPYHQGTFLLFYLYDTYDHYEMDYIHR